jgi:hypothetical protein
LRSNGGKQPRELDSRMHVKLEKEMIDAERVYEEARINLILMRIRLGMDEFGREIS